MSLNAPIAPERDHACRIVGTPNLEGSANTAPSHAALATRTQSPCIAS